MTQSSLAFGLCQTPPRASSSKHTTDPSALRRLHIPRVSPVFEKKSPTHPSVKPPMMPYFDRLERKEEAAIDAMLSLHRSGSKSEES